MNLTIGTRQEEIQDYKEVYSLYTAAFKEEGEAKLVELLRKSNAFVPELSIVATDKNKIIGHILFTRIKIVSRNKNEYLSLALAPMAVLPNEQNKGIGGELINAGLEKAKEMGFESVIVLGHETYYPKFGFEPASKWGIISPYDVPDNIFMGLELIKGKLSGVTGIVQYPEEFDMI